MTAMNTVEVADGDNATGQARRQVGKVVRR
jgi:hypothetical protein